VNFVKQTKLRVVSSCAASSRMIQIFQDCGGIPVVLARFNSIITEIIMHKPCKKSHKATESKLLDMLNGLRNHTILWELFNSILFVL